MPGFCGKVRDMELVEFLRARLDEDEEVAGIMPADSRAWSYHPDEQHPNYSGKIPEIFAEACNTQTPGFILFEAAPHIARHDPARVLRDVAAKRRILEAHDSDGAHECVDGPEFGDWSLRSPHIGWEVNCLTLRLLALPYDQHEDYRDEWRP